MGQFLSLQDAAEHLGVDYKTVYRLVRAGKLPAGKFGGMYRIRRDDLEAYFQAQVEQTTGRQTSAATASAAPAAVPDTMLKKCGSCYRILKSAEEIAGHCPAAGCDLPLCRACWTAGQRRCADHQPGQDERLAEAQTALARGEIGRLVTAQAGRQLESAWLARFDARVEDIASIYHPTAGEVLKIREWAPFNERDDETLQLMQLLNVGFLDRASQAALPHNECSSYCIPAGALGWGKPAQGLLLIARFVGRLDQYVAPGFDTRPNDLEDLLVLLGELEGLAAERRATVIAGLAAPTGWDEAAASHISDERGRAYRHPAVLPFLVDLETGAVLANRLDERLSKFGYGELFKLPLELEEAAGLAPEIAAVLAGREGLPVAELSRRLDRPLATVLHACQVLARGGHYKLTEEGDLGPVIVRVHA